MQRTGHRSLTGVRAYKTPSEAMLKDISNVLNPPSFDIKKEVELSPKVNTTSVHSNGVALFGKNLNDDPMSIIAKRFKTSESSGLVFNNCVFNFK